MTHVNFKANQLHKDMILALLMYHMTQETRRMLILEAPAAYNDVIGQDVAGVYRKSDGLSFDRNGASVPVN